MFRTARSLLEKLNHPQSLAREEDEDDLLKPNMNRQHSLVPGDSDASSEEDLDADGESDRELDEAEDDEDMETITDALGNTVLRPRVKV